jgi:two-component system sensor histidine kinase/response regulator
MEGGDNEALVAADLVFQTSVDGTVLDVSQDLLDALGYRREELVGKSHALLLSPSWAGSKEYVECWNSAKKGAYKFIKMKLAGKYQQELSVHCSLSPGCDFLGDIISITGCCLNVTPEATKRLEIRCQLDAVRQFLAMLTFGMDGKIVDANDVFLDVVGYFFDEVVGKNCSLLLEKSVSDMLQTVNTTVEVKCRAKDGNTVWLEAVFVAVPEANGKVVKAVMYGTSIQERKTAEHDKTVFLANMSHEIRTPMNGILGMLTLLKGAGNLDDVHRRYLETCMRSAESLLSVLNGILFFSKVDANAIKLVHEAFNLNAVIEDAMDVVSMMIRPEQSISLTSFVDVNVPLCLVGDASRLRQVLLNLLSNGVKFTIVGQVCLEVSLVSRVSSSVAVKFDVSDTGIGISETDQKKLFVPFSQVDGSTTRNFDGSGLGLATCKRIVELFGGELTVKSRLGRGSTFTFTAVFDLDGGDQSLGRALGISPEEASTLERIKVLLVESDATLCASLRETLKYFRCKVVSTRSGKEGLDFMRAASVKDEPFDVVVVADHRSVGELSRVTSSATKVIGLFDESMSSGVKVDARLSKPVRRVALLKLICQLFSDGEALDFKPVRSPSVVATGSESSVLVVEDNAVNREVLAVFLRRCNYDVVEAVDGVDALGKLCEDAFDLVLMDVHMPVLDGISTMRVMKERGYSVPVVVLTADVTDENRVQCKEAGATAVMFKPINMKELVMVMNGILEKAAVLAVPESNSVLFDESFVDDFDAEVRRALIDSWKDSLVAALKHMKYCCESQDWKSLEKVAHSEKGAAAQIGACRVSEFAKEIEFEAKKSEKCDQTQVVALLEELIKAAEATFVYLMRYA